MGSMRSTVSSCNVRMAMPMDSFDWQGQAPPPPRTRNACFLPISEKKGHPQAELGESVKERARAKAEHEQEDQEQSSQLPARIALGGRSGTSQAATRTFRGCALP